MKIEFQQLFGWRGGNMVKNSALRVSAWAMSSKEQRPIFIRIIFGYEWSIYGIVSSWHSYFVLDVGLQCTLATYIHSFVSNISEGSSWIVWLCGPFIKSSSIFPKNSWIWFRYVWVLSSSYCCSCYSYYYFFFFLFFLHSSICLTKVEIHSWNRSTYLLKSSLFNWVWLFISSYFGLSPLFFLFFIFPFPFSSGFSVPGYKPENRIFTLFRSNSFKYPIKWLLYWIKCTLRKIYNILVTEL